MSKELTRALRSATCIISVPRGEFGVKVIIEMAEETELCDLLNRAWVRDRGSSPDRAETGTGSGSEASRAPVPKAIAKGDPL